MPISTVVLCTLPILFLFVDHHFYMRLQYLHRYSFTVFANILVYVVTYIVLRSNNASKTQFGPSERKEFQVHIIYFFDLFSNTLPVYV